MARKRDATPKPARPKKNADLLPKGYEELLGQIKERIRSAQLRAGLAVNRELTELYWQIGRSIVERQCSDGWEKSVVERLALDLQAEFPDMSGFSPRNAWRMRAFYLAYTDEVRKLPRAVAELDGENLPRAVAETPGAITPTCWARSRTPLSACGMPSRRRRSLEPPRPGPLDRKRSLQPPGQGPDVLSENAPCLAIRPCPRDPEKPPFRTGTATVLPGTLCNLQAPPFRARPPLLCQGRKRRLQIADALPVVPITTYG
jgi:hypothetical protein